MPPLVQERDALSVYFDALLREPEEERPVVTEAPPVSTSAVVPAEPVPQPQPSARPAWGEEAFQALLFKVAGLTLAVPLAELSGVQELEFADLTSMPGHISWYLGLIDYRGHSVPVIDTAALVLPQERRARLTTPAQARVRHVVFIDDGRWGLACDDVDEVLRLTPDQVRWRTERTRRRWLAGTVIEHMCALIDPPAFAEMLRTSGAADA